MTNTANWTRSRNSENLTNREVRFRFGIALLVLSVLANLAFVLVARQGAQDTSGRTSFTLQQLSDQANACVLSGNTDSAECRAAREKALQAKASPQATQTPAPVVVTAPGATVVSVVPGPTVTVPLPLPVTSVVTIPGPERTVTAPGTTSPVGVTQTPVTKTQTVTQTQEAPPPDTETQTQTETKTETQTTGPPPLVVIGG